MRDKLKLNAAFVTIPIGIENRLKGIIDLVNMNIVKYDGDHGEKLITTSLDDNDDDVDDKLKNLAKEKQQELIEKLAEVDDDIAEYFLMEEIPPIDELKKAIRKQTIDLNFVPVFVGSAYKNKGVQTLLDGICEYLPSPREITNTALDTNDNEKSFELSSKFDDPLVAYAFKLEDGKFGQLTYMRIYQGILKKGMFVKNVNAPSSKKLKIPRLVRMHADSMEDVDEIKSGEICAVFGVECSSGDTFTEADNKGFNPVLSSMFVPDPVMSLAVAPKDRGSMGDSFGKALQRFTKEDPTLRVNIDPESKETILSGMGELHLEVYIERMKREYNTEVISGQPQVNYRETITQKTEFNYLHKKQSGGSGQYGRVVGYAEPITDEELEELENDENNNDNHKQVSSSDQKRGNIIFENQIIGNAIPPEYISAIEKGFIENAEKGGIIGSPVKGIKIVLTDGQHHAVDSSELAFKAAARGAFLEVFKTGNPQLLEPLMDVSVEVPEEYQGDVIGGLNKMRGMIQDTYVDDGHCKINAHVPLNEMFGYATKLRSATQAKGEFTMSYLNHSPMPLNDQKNVIDKHQKQLEELRNKKK